MSGTHITTTISGTAAAHNTAVSTVKVAGLTGRGAGTYAIKPGTTTVINGVTLSVIAGDANNVIISASGTPGTGSDDGTITLTYTDSAGDVAVVTVPVVVGLNSVQLPNSSAADGGATTDEITAVSSAAASHPGCVAFTESTGGAALSPAASASVSGNNLPYGLSHGGPALCAGHAAPGRYDGLTVTVTDSAGAAAAGGFNLTVMGRRTTPPSPPRPGWPGHGPDTAGNFVNRYGNGPDDYRQIVGAGAVVVGWPATQTNPASIVDREQTGTDGRYPVYHLEFMQQGYGQDVASGFCLAESARHADVLEPCDSADPAQGWYLNGQGFLVNQASGLSVTPHGPGGQLTDTADPASGGGSGVYHWVSQDQLPA